MLMSRPTIIICHDVKTWKSGGYGGYPAPPAEKVKWERFNTLLHSYLAEIETSSWTQLQHYLKSTLIAPIYWRSVHLPYINNCQHGCTMRALHLANTAGAVFFLTLSSTFLCKKWSCLHSHLIYCAVVEAHNLAPRFFGTKGCCPGISTPTKNNWTRSFCHIHWLSGTWHHKNF